MSEPGNRRGRIHDAEGAREALLNAAEEVFTEHGFDGARIDAIAALAGYNKSLIFQYYGDKVGLYLAVIKRADQEMGQLQREIFAPLLADESVGSDVRKFKVLLEKVIGMLYDYMAEHPRLLRMIIWEQAEGWKTYKKIYEQFANSDTEPVVEIFNVAKKNGLLHSDFSPLLQLTMAMEVCLTHLSWLPLYQLMQPDENFASAAARARSRAYVINFIVAGILIDPSENHP
ncbi:MAG TPA: TetR/AcrR family transcriptional regulator [Ktedonobacteraceae bacterium]